MEFVYSSVSSLTCPGADNVSFSKCKIFPNYIIINLLFLPFTNWRCMQSWNTHQQDYNIIGVSYCWIIYLTAHGVQTAFFLFLIMTTVFSFLDYIILWLILIAGRFIRNGNQNQLCEKSNLHINLIYHSNWYNLFQTHELFINADGKSVYQYYVLISKWASLLNLQSQ